MSRKEFEEIQSKGILSKKILLVIFEVLAILFLPDFIFGAVTWLVDYHYCQQQYTVTVLSCGLSMVEHIWNAVGLHLQLPGGSDVPADTVLRLSIALHGYINKALEFILIALIANAFIGSITAAAQKYRDVKSVQK